MRTLRKYLALGLAALMVALTLGPAAEVQAQVANQGIFIAPFKTKTTTRVITAVATDVMLRVRYVGSATGAATVAVAGNNAIAFVANGAADTTIGTCGGTAGTLDLTNAACDTMIEVVNLVNQSAGWIAVLDESLGTDTSNGKLNNLSATDAKSPAGVAILGLTSANLFMTAALHPVNNDGSASDLRDFVPGVVRPNSPIAGHPFADRDTVLLYASENITTTDNAANLFKVFCVVGAYSGTKKIYAENVNELYREAAAATTTTGKIDEFLNAGGVPPCQGGKLLVRVNGNTTLTAPTIILTGYQRPTQNTF